MRSASACAENVMPGTVGSSGTCGGTAAGAEQMAGKGGRTRIELGPPGSGCLPETAGSSLWQVEFLASRVDSLDGNEEEDETGADSQIA